MRVQRITSITIIAALILTLLAACGTINKHPSSNSTQINPSDNSGISDTAPTTDPTKAEENGSLSSAFDESLYTGTWSTQGINWINGGMILDITISSNNITFKFFNYKAAPECYDASFAYAVYTSYIIDNQVNIAFADDTWGNSGNVLITFIEDRIVCDFSNVVSNDGLESMWGFRDGSFVLTKNDAAYKAMEYTTEDLYALFPELNPDNNTNLAPSYDPSKASGILAEMGMTEAQFREYCQPLKRDISNSTSLTISDLRDYPSCYIGECYRFVSTIGNPLSIEVSQKGQSSDGYTTYISIPNEDWQGYILIFDMRDDVYSPTISIGDRICPYLIFTGIQTINGIDYVCFWLISVDKQ